MPLITRKRVLAAKIESSPGEVETLTAAEAAVNVFDAKIDPDLDIAPRDGQGAFAPRAGVAVGRTGTATFETELHGGSSDPFWVSVLLPACGWVATNHVFTPRTVAPGTAVKTLTIGLYQDGRLKRLRGCAGTAVLKFNADKPVRIAWTFKGIWEAPTDATILAPTYPTTAPLRFASSGLAIGSWTPAVESLTIDLGNDVQVREDSRDPSGYGYAMIGSRLVKGQLNPEAVLVTTENIYAKWLAATLGALSMSLGSAGNLVSFSMPQVQWTKIAEADRGGRVIDTIDYQACRDSDAGDDELEITIG